MRDSRLKAPSTSQATRLVHMAQPREDGNQGISGNVQFLGSALGGRGGGASMTSPVCVTTQIGRSIRGLPADIREQGVRAALLLVLMGAADPRPVPVVRAVPWLRGAAAAADCDTLIRRLLIRASSMGEPGPPLPISPPGWCGTFPSITVTIPHWQFCLRSCGAMDVL